MPETRYWYGLQPNLPVKSPTRFPEDPQFFTKIQAGLELYFATQPGPAEFGSEFEGRRANR